MALSNAEHRAIAEDLAEQITHMRKGAPLYLASVAEAQLHATLATIPEPIEIPLPPKPTVAKAAPKRTPKATTDVEPLAVVA